MNKKISIIVPIYNADKWLKRCLESLINQTHKNIEIILINDGSKDNSKEICDKYSRMDNRIKVIHKNNAGTSAARNDGLKIALGDYIQFVDSDDWLEENMCELLLENMEKNESDLVICGLRIMKNGVEIRKPYLPNNKLRVKEDIDNYLFLRKIFSSPCNKLYKREYIQTYFKENTSLGEDLIFNLEYLRKIDTTLVIEEALYNVCLDNSESLIRGYRSDRLDIVIDLVTKELKFCEDIYGRQSDKTEIYNSYILGVHSFFRDIICSDNKSKKDINLILDKYIQHPTIKNALYHTKMNRIDYKLFKNLLKIKNKKLIFIFFKLKTLRKTP
ncbi:glycosyltransferase family 2 protein [Guptibacillus hwajinpoensis]|uniref:glycosyltransferase family 2 protein n=1 Tax=Guptibacillus hwajinpoensis TaxID=208199 RepID=UPI003D08C672